MTSTRTAIAQTFDVGFDGPTAVPGEPDYDRARAVWNGTVDPRPALVAQRRST